LVLTEYIHKRTAAAHRQQADQSSHLSVQKMVAQDTHEPTKNVSAFPHTNKLIHLSYMIQFSQTQYF